MTLVLVPLKFLPNEDAGRGLKQDTASAQVDMRSGNSHHRTTGHLTHFREGSNLGQGMGFGIFLMNFLKFLNTFRLTQK